MENENKEKVILTDEELKEVTGGKEVLNKETLLHLSSQCEKFRGVIVCIQHTICAWVNNKCMPNPNKFEY